MPRCSAAGLDFMIIPAAFNTPLEFLTGFTFDKIQICNESQSYFLSVHLFHQIPANIEDLILHSLHTSIKSIVKFQGQAPFTRVYRISVA